MRKFEAPELNVIRFEIEDVITTSNIATEPGTGDIEMPEDNDGF